MARVGPQRHRKEEEEEEEEEEKLYWSTCKVLVFLV